MNTKNIDNEAVYWFYINRNNYSIDDIAEHFDIHVQSVFKIIRKQKQIERIYFVVPSLSQENTFYLFDEIVEKKFIVDNSKFVFPANIFNQFENEYLQSQGFKFKN